MQSLQPKPFSRKGIDVPKILEEWIILMDDYFQLSRVYCFISLFWPLTKPGGIVFLSPLNCFYGGSHFSKKKKWSKPLGPLSDCPNLWEF